MWIENLSMPPGMGADAIQNESVKGAAGLVSWSASEAKD